MVYLGDKCLIPTECPASREGREKGEKRGPKNIKSTGLNLHWYPLGIHSEGISQERCCIPPVTGSETLFKGGRVTWCWWSPLAAWWLHGLTIWGQVDCQKNWNLPWNFQTHDNSAWDGFGSCSYSASCTQFSVFSGYGQAFPAAQFCTTGWCWQSHWTGSQRDPAV